MSPGLAKLRRPPAPGHLEYGHLPAPAGGLNAFHPMSAMPPTDAALLYNMIAAENGLRVRSGYREWVTGLTGASDNQIRTMIPYNGSSGSANKLFAATSSGIYDCTSTGAVGAISIAFGTTTGRAGYGECVTMVTSAGHFLIYCDEVNGMYIYTQGAGTWAKVAMGGGAGEISGVDPANFVFPFVFKNRLWAVQRDTSLAWYLGVNAVFGAATSFNFAGRFQKGGYLVGLWNYTGDGGAGMDDKIVGVSSGGDVVVYQLSDPSSPSGTVLVGSWDAGGVPTGRRIANQSGGDLLLLTKGGLLPMSRLLVGAARDDGNQYESRKISALFNQIMVQKSSLLGWSMHTHPEDNALIVTVPTETDANTEQLAMAISQKSWSRYRDLPIFSAGAWDGKFYFGSKDGIVYVNDGYVDNQLISDPNSYSDITFSGITAFQHGGNARQKQLKQIRTFVQSDGGSVGIAAEARYDYDLTEVVTAPAGNTVANGWDVGEWDEALWGGEYAPIQTVFGAVGQGTAFAVAFKGKSRSRTVLIGMDVAFRMGGFF